MTDEEVTRIVRAAGLDKYLAQFPEQLTAALKGAEALAARLPRDLPPREESAHTFSLPARKEPRS